MAKEGFLKRYRTFIVYNIYGFTATILETVLYWLLFSILGLHNIPATLIATFITITYAFFTNKIMVYRSRDWRVGTLLKEMGEFYGFRAITAIFNVGFMYMTVDVLAWYPVAMKAIAALIVGLMNYILGKKVVFKNRRPYLEMEKEHQL